MSEMVTHTVPSSGTGRMMNRHFDAVPSELRLQTGSSTSSRTKWAAAAGVVALVLMTAAFLASAPPKKQLLTYAKPLPGGVMRVSYKCDAPWYCATQGAQCTNGVPVDVSKEVEEKCEKRNMLNELMNAWEFKAIGEELYPEWTCPHNVLDVCGGEDLPFGCDYEAICAGDLDMIEVVAAMAMDYKPEQSDQLDMIKKGMEGFSTEAKSIDLKCQTPTYDPDTCMSMNKLGMAKKVIGKVLSAEGMDEMTAAMISKQINSVMCETADGLYTCMDKKMQENMGMVIGLAAARAKPMANKRAFTKKEDAKNAFSQDPTMASDLKCHEMCKGFKKANVPIFKDIHPMCCTTAGYN